MCIRYGLRTVRIERHGQDRSFGISKILYDVWILSADFIDGLEDPYRNSSIIWFTHRKKNRASTVEHISYCSERQNV